jgi:DNA-binding NarL/FixJ family response regulator
VLADDHPIFRQGLKSLLEREGFSVLGCADDGLEAIKLVEKFRPDIAILDFSMPRLNGLGAATEIRRVSARTKIIFLTVHREEQYVLETMTAGGKACAEIGSHDCDGPVPFRGPSRDAYLSPSLRISRTFP